MWRSPTIEWQTSSPGPNWVKGRTVAFSTTVPPPMTLWCSIALPLVITAFGRYARAVQHKPERRAWRCVRCGSPLLPKYPAESQSHRDEIALQCNASVAVGADRIHAPAGLRTRLHYSVRLCKARFCPQLAQSASHQKRNFIPPRSACEKDVKSFPSSAMQNASNTIGVLLMMLNDRIPIQLHVGIYPEQEYVCGLSPHNL